MVERLKYKCRHYNRPPAATEEEACHPKIAHWCNNGCPGPMMLDKYNKTVEINAHAKEKATPIAKEVKAMAEQSKKDNPPTIRRECATEGCDKAQWSKAEGLCQSCYRKKYPPRHFNKGECLTPGCTSPAELKGQCRPCYARWKYQQDKKLEEKSELQLAVDRGQTDKRKKIKAANNPTGLCEKMNEIIEKKEEALAGLIMAKQHIKRQIEALKTTLVIFEDEK